MTFNGSDQNRIQGGEGLGQGENQVKGAMRWEKEEHL